MARLRPGTAGATLVTLWGPGGVGKTRLAREHAAAERARGRVVAWADVASSRTRREVVTTLATALGVVLVETEGGELEALAQAATAQRALVVADNLEQIDDDARRALGQLASALGAGASLLITSREQLGAPAEVVIAIEPLGEDDAVALFEALGGGADDATTRAIVRRLDALPLALELAAARVPLLGAPALLARLDRKLDVLGTARADRPARHATLRAAIAWSWELLDEGEQAALRACASFEGPFDAALAEAVIGGAEADALDRLERLRGRALVHAATDAGGRTSLRLLESVRDFAREGVCDAALAQRHAGAVLERAEPLAEAAACGRDTLPALEASRADLEAASRGSGPLAARATLALAALLAITGPATAAVERIDRALTWPVDPTLTARLLVAKGAAYRALGLLDEARQALERDGTGTGTGTTFADAEAARGLGAVLRSLGDGERALAALERALAIHRQLGDRAREGLCLGEIGAVHQSAGRLAQAQRFHAEAIAIHVATGGRRAEGVERSYLAVATHRAGDPAAALPLHEAALAIHREAGHRRLEGAERLHLAFVHHELGALPAARDAFVAARADLAAAGARGLLGIALALAARLEVDAGESAAALLLLAEASQVATASWPRVVATRHLVDGHRWLVNGEPARAPRHPTRQPRPRAVISRWASRRSRPRTSRSRDHAPTRRWTHARSKAPERASPSWRIRISWRRSTSSRRALAARRCPRSRRSPRVRRARCVAR